MCGIFAVKGKDAVSRAYEGLRKLEYRGYDSCGIGVVDNEQIELYRVVGYVDKLATTGVLDVDSEIVVAHTRWATNGGVTEYNSHPHKSASGRFAVVHNGIIENDKELKERHLSKVDFSSETDTEVIVQLMDYFSETHNTFEALKQVALRLKGSYAIVLIERGSNTIYFARKSSPLVISKVGDEYELSSDINGFVDKSQIYYVPDNTIGYIDNKLVVYDNNYNIIDFNWVDYTRESGVVSKGDYPHFMLKEIMEIPRTLKSTFENFNSSKFALPKVIERVLIIGCGTSYHSGLMGSKFIEKYSSLKCECIIASEFIYNDYLVLPNTLAIFISQSGETADTLKALSKAKDLGLYTLAITNVVGSTITREAHSYIYEKVGAEICVASTKAYTSQVLMLLLISNTLINVAKGNYCDYVCQASEVEVGSRFYDCVEVSSTRTINYLPYNDRDIDKLWAIDILGILESVDKVIGGMADSEQIFLIGKDYDYISAMEGALKIKEVSYIFTDAYPCGELKHGTLALIEDGSIVLSIMTRRDLIAKCLNSMQEIGSRGGRCIVLSQLSGVSSGYEVIKLPKLKEIFMSIVSIIPIDLIAYRLSVSRGYNPDKPRNLAKSVTVE